jgi:hypothetical protein
MPLVLAGSNLHITVRTSKPSYLREETVKVGGEVALTENPLRGMLVALEVRDEHGDIIAVGTNQTNENGLFAFAFNVAPDTGSQTFTAYVSARWENQTAIGCATFLIEASGTTTYHVGPSGDEAMSTMAILILIILLGILLPSIFIVSLFSFPGQKDAKVEAKPSVPSRNLVYRKHRVCTNCGERFQRFYRFCPYCLVYHA